jgi:ABC-type multidrug transport system fused ATPase/permease subunit
MRLLPSRSNIGMGILEAVRRARDLLPRAQQRRFSLLVLVQMLTAMLDLAGVLLITVVGILAVTNMQPGSALPGPIQSLVSAAGARGWDIKQLTMACAVLAAVFLVAKSVASGLLARKALRFLARQQAALSASLARRLLAEPITVIEQQHSMTTAFAVIQGATNAVVGILGSVALIITECALLVVFAITLLVLNPMVTLVAVGFLLAVALYLHRVLGGWSERVGATNARTAIRGNVAIQETVNSYREITVSYRMGLYVRRIRELVVAGAGAQADSAFISQVPKLVFEATLVVGAVFLAGLQFAIADTAAAVGTMVLFLAAGGRVLPSIMRLQGAFITIRFASGGAVATFDLADALGDVPEPAEDARTLDDLRLELASTYGSFNPSIRVANVTYRYPGSEAAALLGISLDVPPGTSLALVGSTGAGKSTLADVMLGILKPESGTVLLSGETPYEAARRWPGGISYVPQQVMLVDGTVRDNVALGLPLAVVDDDRVWQALAEAHLADFLREARNGLDTVIGERGVKLSGGQRQRLGVARALFSRPKVLVLDEATSALDAQTEVLISRVISGLHGRVTVVVIAHRLATIREFDCIAYLENGRLVAQGAFAELRSQVPAFNDQAQILGL